MHEESIEIDDFPFSITSATMFLELVSVFCRWMIVEGILRIILLIVWPFFIIIFPNSPLSDSLYYGLNNINASIHLLAICVAILPYIWSLLSFISLVRAAQPFFTEGRDCTIRVLGARTLSQREQSTLAEAVKIYPPSIPAEIRSILTARGNRLYCFAIDNLNEINAFTIGDSIFLTTGLIKSPYLSALFAHELGHLRSFDSNITLALRRLILYPAAFVFRAVGKDTPGVVMRSVGASIGYVGGGGIVVLLALGGGGFGAFATQTSWNKFWRERDFVADRFAKRCGQGKSLIAYLEKYQVFDIAIPFYHMAKPYNEERIDRLLD